MTDPALLELLRTELPRLVADAVREAMRPPPADDPAGKFCSAVVSAYDAKPFFAVDLVDFVAAQPVLRRELGEAMQRLCKTDRTPTPQQLGMYLGGLVQRSPAGFVVEAEDRRGTTVWRVQDMRPKVPPAPRDPAAG